MCGLAGIFALSGPGRHWLPPARALAVLEAAIAHRGRDGRGSFVGEARRPDGRVATVALLHRRMSILDHSGGAQPMVARGAGKAGGAPGGSGEFAVVFNGHIANHRELRRELAAAGEPFASDHSDTEALLRAWCHWGDRAVSRLDGMYAAALWDGAAGRLVLIRDRAGEKPLWWARCGSGTTAFASTPAALWAVMAVLGHPPRPDRAAVARWLRFGAGLWEESPVHDAAPVPPGAVLELGDGPPVCVYRDELPSRARPGESERGPLTVASAGALVARAVAERLDADVPVGVFLSGGVDSALVASCVRSELGAGAGVRAMTVRVPWPGFDESPRAASTASALGLEHAVLECRGDSAADDLRLLIGQLGLPLADSSLLPTHWVSRAAAERVKVVLGGDGGDELFAGYERHAGARWLSRLRPLLSRLPAGEARRPGAGRSRGEHLRRMIHAARGDGYPELLAVMSPPLLARLWPSAPQAPAPFGPVAPGTDAPDADPMRWDFLHALPNDMLLKVDTASMACPLEVRSPLLSRALVDAALAAPAEILTRPMPGAGGGQARRGRKALLREVALARGVPADVVDGPKRGFAVPIDEWLRSDFGGLRRLLMDTLSSPEPFGPASWGLDLELGRSGGKRGAGLASLLEEHLGTGLSGVIRADHGAALWSVLVLSLWCRGLAAAVPAEVR